MIHRLEFALFQVIEIGGGGELLEKRESLDFLPGFAFEGFANRDSTQYIEHYQIPDARTVLRGTIRYTGYSEHVLGLIRMGLISAEPHPCLHPGGPDITWVTLFLLQFSRSDLKSDCHYFISAMKWRQMNN